MTFLKLKFNFICFIALFSITYAANAKIKPPFDNISIKNIPKSYSYLKFQDINGNTINLKDYSGNIVILNFWATWCAPCKEEMPSLDKLQVSKSINNLKIFPINIEKKNVKRSKEFYLSINVKNIDIYFDPESSLANILSLRGVPTTVLFNDEGKEFARIIGSIDFMDKKFIYWLSQYK